MYDMILGGYILKSFGLNIKYSKHAIKAGDVPLKGFTAPTIDLGM